MKVTHDGRRITVEVTPDGEGLVSHAGSALLAQVTDKMGLSGRCRCGWQRCGSVGPATTPGAWCATWR